MRCERCGRDVDVSGVFPGGSLACGCGATCVVPTAARAPSAPPPSHALYREPAAGTPLCPRCELPLAGREAHGEDVLGCGVCGGAFVWHETLARLLSAPRPAASGAKPPAFEREVRYLRCPACTQQMARMNFGKRSGVIVDACRLHGTWFDAGELEAVLEFVGAGGMASEAVTSTAPSPEAAEAVRQAEVMMTLEGLRDRQRVEENVELTKDILDLVAYDGLRGLWRRLL